MSPRDELYVLLTTDHGMAPVRTLVNLEKLFSRAGKVDNVRVMRDMATGRARGFAFVEMSTDAEAEAAVRTMIAWAGDDPDREGLRDTPRRVAKAYREFFKGYEECPLEVLSRTFEDVAGYDDMVMLRDIEFNSHCEHHMVPFIGRAHVAYLPTDQVVGISKLSRLVDAFARRLQLQERLTRQVARTLEEVLQPRGVAVIIEASHGCMSTRGVNQHGVSMVTKCWLGDFRSDPELRRELMDSLHGCGTC